jgi:hypothetical protein
VVLDQLARHYHRPFADQWDFVDYVHQQKLGLDLTSPRRPPAPGYYPSCPGDISAEANASTPARVRRLRGGSGQATHRQPDQVPEAAMSVANDTDSPPPHRSGTQPDTNGSRGYFCFRARAATARPLKQPNAAERIPTAQTPACNHLVAHPNEAARLRQRRQRHFILPSPFCQTA